MRQVPDPATTAFGIVGDGRLARHFRHFLTQLGLSVRQWSNRDPGTPAEALGSCNTILLLVADVAIGPFVEGAPELLRKRLVHCAGGLQVPGVPVAHPLMAFGPDLYELSTYRAIPFIVDADGPSLPELLPGLPNPWYRVPPAERPYYHALCVMAGNFTTLLWQKLSDEFQERFGIPTSAVHPYIRGICANLIASSGNALTGPLVRGDTETIAANLRALDGDPFEAVYAAFVRAYEQRV